MSSLADMTNGDFHHDVLELVYSKFGSEGLSRFFEIYGNNLGDYTRDRHIWLGDLTTEQMAQQSEASSHTQAA